MEAEVELVAEVKNLPVLRFPEFIESWTLKRIVEILKRVSEPVKVEEDKLYQQIGIRSHGKGIFHKEFVDGQALGNKRVFWVQENTFIVNIVFAWEQAIGKTTSSELGMIASHRFPMYFPVKGQSDVDYLVYFFLTKKGKFLLELASPGGAGRNKTLGQKEFENLKFLIPSISEQKKIASFLTVVDDKIQQLIKKKNLLENYKNGVMQQIFSQQIRFKDENGLNFPMWEEKKLKAIAKRVTQKNKNSDTTFVLTNSANQGIVSQQDYFDKDIANQDNLEGYYVVEVDDFVYNPRISTPAPVGPVKRNRLAKGVMSPLYTVFRFEKQNLEFLELFFETTIWYKYMKSVANYGARHDRMSISTEDFLNLPIPQPPVNEQAKIVAFLSELERKVNTANKQLEQAKLFKKGLLQQMFV
jgi:type I restriction enzyme, S subunit